MYINAQTFVFQVDSGSVFRAALSAFYENNNIVFTQWDVEPEGNEYFDCLEEIIAYAYLEGFQDCGDVVIYQSESGESESTWLDLYEENPEEYGKEIDRITYMSEENMVGNYC